MQTCAGALEARGAEIEVAADGTFARGARAPRRARQIGSLLLEGGAALHAAAWDEGVVDYVRLYVTPHVLGPAACRFSTGGRFRPRRSSSAHVEPLGPDVLIEGYVHRPR